MKIVSFGFQYILANSFLSKFIINRINFNINRCQKLEIKEKEKFFQYSPKMNFILNRSLGEFQSISNYAKDGNNKHSWSYFKPSFITIPGGKVIYCLSSKHMNYEFIPDNMTYLLYNFLKIAFFIIHQNVLCKSTHIIV